MALLFTKPLPLGNTAPAFTLPDAVSGQAISLEEVRGSKGTIVMIICNHCPYVKHVAGEISRITKDYQDKGIGFVAINPNDAERYPEDSFAKMTGFAGLHDFQFPYLYDESQDVAKAYDAVCTPEFNLFDADLKCVYRGQLDGSRPGNEIPNDGNSLRAALDNLLSGNPPIENQLPSSGCSIKWRTNEQ